MHVFEDQVAEGAKVASRITARGTHRGEFQGVPATGKQIEVSAQILANVVDGKVNALWVDADLVTLLRQIGAMPG